LLVKDISPVAGGSTLASFIVGPAPVILNLVDFGKVSLKTKMTTGDKWNKLRPVVAERL